MLLPQAHCAQNFHQSQPQCGYFLTRICSASPLLHDCVDESGNQPALLGSSNSAPGIHPSPARLPNSTYQFGCRAALFPRDCARCIKFQEARSQFEMWGKVVRSEPKYLRRLRSGAGKISRVPTVTVPTPRRTADQFCWQPGLLTSGTAARCRLPTRGTFPLRSREQWSIAAFVPVTVSGPRRYLTGFPRLPKNVPDSPNKI
jgi:hypothetical protein